MTNDPVNLDTHRDMISQKSAEIRRRLNEIQANQNALQDRQEQFELLLLDVPAETLPDYAARAHALIMSSNSIPNAQNPCCQQLIADALDALGRLCNHAEEHR